MGDDTKEWARNGSFMKKPATGWLHDDAALTNGDGVYYPVKVCAMCVCVCVCDVCVRCVSDVCV